MMNKKQQSEKTICSTMKRILKERGFLWLQRRNDLYLRACKLALPLAFWRCYMPQTWRLELVLPETIIVDCSFQYFLLLSVCLRFVAVSSWSPRRNLWVAHECWSYRWKLTLILTDPGGSILWYLYSAGSNVGSNRWTVIFSMPDH